MGRFLLFSQRYKGVHRGTQGYTGVYRGTQGYTGAHRGTQGYTWVHLGTQGYTGVYRNTQGYTGIHRGTQGYTLRGTQWYRVVHGDTQADRVTQWYTGAGVHRGTQGCSEAHRPKPCFYDNIVWNSIKGHRTCSCECKHGRVAHATSAISIDSCSAGTSTSSENILMLDQRTALRNVYTYFNLFYYHNGAAREGCAGVPLRGVGGFTSL